MAILSQNGVCNGIRKDLIVENCSVVLSRRVPMSTGNPDGIEKQIVPAGNHVADLNYSDVILVDYFPHPGFKKPSGPNSFDRESPNPALLNCIADIPLPIIDLPETGGKESKVCRMSPELIEGLTKLCQQFGYM